MAVGREEDHAPARWYEGAYAILKASGIRLFAYVPDAGISALIKLAHGDCELRAVRLTTEEEGIGLLAGAWLGGVRATLLMQSSGVGNCLNALAMIEACRFPFLTIVSMRGEWGEVNPWQIPMGRRTDEALRLMNVHVVRLEDSAEVERSIAAAVTMAFEGGQPVAVLLTQRLIGAKKWAR